MSKSSAPTTTPRRQPRRWCRIALCAALVLVGGIVSLGLAATCRPAWYRPCVLDAARLRDDKARLFALEDQISAALNAGREIRIELPEDQVNRWLAAIDEIYPTGVLVSAGIEQPQITFEEGKVRLAGTVRQGDWGAVLSLTCRPEMRDDGVVIKFERGSVGVLPVATGWIDDVLGRVVPPGEVRRLRSGAVALPLEWTWPNGKRRCRVREVCLSAGLAAVVLEPVRAGPR